MAYNVILERPTLNTVKAIVAPYLLLILFELDNRKVGKLNGDEKVVRECYYVSLKSLGRKEEIPICEMSRSNKAGKKVETEAIVVLSTLVEEHRRPHPKPTFQVVPIALDPGCRERTVQISKDLGPTIRDGIAKLLR